MEYELYAWPAPIPEKVQSHVLPLVLDSEQEALDEAQYLAAKGWHVYRLTGPDGFTLNEIELSMLCARWRRRRGDS